MKSWSGQARSIVGFAIAVLAYMAVVKSGVWLNFMMMALYAALMAQAWNIIGGFGGQFSFGHALFFGTGAYAIALLQMRLGINPWLALPICIALCALLGAAIGWLSFRYGLRGSYFALITLAFAEVFRIIAVSAPFTGAGVGLMVPLKQSAANMQFPSRHGYIALILFFVVLALSLSVWLQHSRFGAQLQAVRDDEDAAQAVGVDPLRVKIIALALSGGLMGVAGAFYVQVFQYIDPGLAYGPHTSVEALVGAIVGGMGTVWGPIVGAFALHTLAELTRNLFGALPGINLVVYGVALILIVLFAPSGLAGLVSRVRDRKPCASGSPHA